MASRKDPWKSSVLSTTTKGSIYAHRESFSEVTRVESSSCLFLLLQVALVHLPPRILPGFIFYGKDLSAEMLKSGWAVTYEQVFLPNINNYARFFDIYLIGWC